MIPYQMQPTAPNITYNITPNIITTGGTAQGGRGGIGQGGIGGLGGQGGVGQGGQGGIGQR